MTNGPTRREFLSRASIALTALHYGGRGAFEAGVEHLLLSPRDTGNSLLADPMEDAELRSLAAHAIEAARAAGASYADIRLGASQQLEVGVISGEYQPSVFVNAAGSYGIRVLVGGGMAFVYGYLLTSDAIVAAVRDAVATARGLAKVMRQPVTFVPAEVISGEWTASVRIDPFTVPIDEQAALCGAINAAASRVKGCSVGFGVDWERETRVFASTEGAVQTQRFCHMGVGERSVFAVIGRSLVSLAFPEPTAASGGYECLAGVPGYTDRVTALAVEAQELAALPSTTLDVGRYDVVLDGGLTAVAIGRMLGPALELDRALGNEAGGPGTTFAAPPDRLLGTALMSPLITLNTDRSVPTYGAARWDDDGVACETYPVVERGVLLDYYSTRTTAGALQPWYDRRGLRLRSRGCSRAQVASDPPLARAGHLALRPSGTRASLADLCRNVVKGIVVRNPDVSGFQVLSTDQQMASAQLGNRSVAMFEIARGQVVRRVTNMVMQFQTKKFWKASVRALGDASTVRSTLQYDLVKGQPNRAVQATAAAPAVHFGDVDVIQLPRE